jgi:hypothetical protein
MAGLNTCLIVWYQAGEIGELSMMGCLTKKTGKISYKSLVWLDNLTKQIGVRNRAYKKRKTARNVANSNV